MSADLQEVEPVEDLPAAWRPSRAAWITGTLVVAAAVASLIWSQLPPRTYALSGGLQAASTVVMRAGAAIEMCTVAVPGAKPVAVLHVDNPGDQAVTLTSIDPILYPYLTTTSVRAYTTMTDSSPLPRRIAPHGSLMVEETMARTTFAMQPGDGAYTDRVRVRYRVFGTVREQQLTFGGIDNPMYIGLQAPGADGKACPTTN
jgi:hypothetical protein